MYRILYVDPVGPDPPLQKTFEQYLQGYLQDTNFTVEVRSLRQGPLDLEYQLYVSLIGPEVMRITAQAEQEGFDAVVIGCFFDPHLEAAKELSRGIPVIGPAEASMKLASSLGRRFSILAANRKVISPMRDLVQRYGCQDALASFRSMDLSVEELADRNGAAEKKMLEETEEAVRQDGAECVILGCTLQMGCYRELQKQAGVPVIDVALAALFEAVHRVILRERCGWSMSQVGSYQTSPAGRLRQWGLDTVYAINL